MAYVTLVTIVMPLVLLFMPLLAPNRCHAAACRRRPATHCLRRAARHHAAPCRHSAARCCYRAALSYHLSPSFFSVVVPPVTFVVPPVALLLIAVVMPSVAAIVPPVAIVVPPVVVLPLAIVVHAASLTVSSAGRREISRSLSLRASCSEPVCLTSIACLAHQPDKETQVSPGRCQNLIISQGTT